MKKLVILITFTAVSGLAFANGISYSVQPAQPVSTKKPMRVSTWKQAYYRTAYFTPGSLRLNIKRVARRFGWNKVVWTAHDDYQWVTSTAVRKPNLASVMNAVLANYPLQAVFYQGNHVLVIQPRTLR